MPLPNPNYVLNFTDPAKTGFVVTALQTDGTISPNSNTLDPTALTAHTSIIFYGKGHPSYGERIQDNLLNMLESFANKVRPVHVIEGQVWYKNATFTDLSNPGDPTIAGLYVYTGAGPFNGWQNVPFSSGIAGDLNMGGFKIINLGTPTLATDATTKAYVDTQDNLRVLKAGDTITGPLTLTAAAILSTGANIVLSGALTKITIPNAPLLGTDGVNKTYADTKVAKSGDTMAGNLDFGAVFKAVNLATPTAAGDATNKGYTDASFVFKAGDIMSGALNMGANFIHNVTDPVSPQDAATKLYVDTATGGSGDTFTSSFTYSGGLASTSILNLTQTGPNDPGPFNVNMAHLHSTDDSQYIVPPNFDLDQYYRLFGASGYQRVNFTAPITNAGIPYTANATYNATLTIDGTPFVIAVIVTTFATFTFFDLVNDINSQLGTAGIARVIDGDSWLSIVSKSTGTASTVLITDGPAPNLFSSITNFLTIPAAVPGFGASLVAGYPLIDLTTALTGYDTVKVPTRPTEVLSSFTLNPRTPDPTTSGSAQAQVDIPIITATTSAFTIEGGDFTVDLTPGTTFDINENTGNNGSYTVLSSTFNDSNRVTTVNVVETIPSPFSTPDGSTISYAFVPQNNSDILTKFWSDTLVARDIQTSTGATTFTFNGGHQDAWLTGTITGASATGLANAATVYTASVFIDGTLNLITVTGSAAQTYTTLIAQINADLTGATASLENSGVANSGKIRITSASTGRASTVSIADTTPNLLFGSLTAFDTFSFPRPGLDYTKGLNRLWVYVNGVKQFLDDDYYEDGGYATLQSTVTFSYTVPVAARVEFMVFNT